MPSRSVRSVAVAALAAAAMVVASPRAGAWTVAGDDVEGDIVVLAAASLTDAFTAIGEEFESDHPDVDVSFNFAASSDLVTQIDEGAPADVFASADQRNMDKLVDAERVDGEPATFATNSLAIIVEPGNPAGITGIESLADPDLIVLTCDPEVPIGRYTQEVLEEAGVEVTPDSFEESVRGIVTKVVEGEADAGLVYVTDVIAAGDAAEGVDIPAGINVVAEYPITAVTDAPNRDGAVSFTEFVLGEDGQAILADHGFGRIDADGPETIRPDTTTPATTEA